MISLRSCLFLLAMYASVAFLGCSKPSSVIADPALEKAIRDEWENRRNTVISTDVTNLASLNAKGYQIKSLEGIQHLENLKDLILDDNQISDLRPLADLTKLEKLSINNNRVSDLRPLAGLFMMENLSATDNKIVDLTPLAKMSRLGWLDMTNNKIVDLTALKNKPGLVKLVLAENKIKDIQVLAGLKMLQYLDLMNNSVSSINPISKLTDLNYLDLSQNPIGDIQAISGLSNLTDLALVDTNLKDISPLSQLTKLHWLDLSDNQIQNIDVLVILNKLTFLYLHSNRVTDLLPILANRGIGSDDKINVERNPIDCSNPIIQEQVSILKTRGVLLMSPCGKLVEDGASNQKSEKEKNPSDAASKNKLPEEFFGKWVAISNACGPNSILNITEEKLIWKYEKDTDTETYVYFDTSEDFPKNRYTKFLRHTLKILEGPSYNNPDRTNLVSFAKYESRYSKKPEMVVFRHDYKDDDQYFSMKEKKTSFASQCTYIRK